MNSMCGDLELAIDKWVIESTLEYSMDFEARPRLEACYLDTQSDSTLYVNSENLRYAGT